MPTSGTTSPASRRLSMASRRPSLLLDGGGSAATPSPSSQLKRRVSLALAGVQLARSFRKHKTSVPADAAVDDPPPPPDRKSRLPTVVPQAFLEGEVCDPFDEELLAAIEGDELTVSTPRASALDDSFYNYIQPFALNVSVATDATGSAMSPASPPAVGGVGSVTHTNSRSALTQPSPLAPSILAAEAGVAHDGGATTPPHEAGEPPTTGNVKDLSPSRADERIATPQTTPVKERAAHPGQYRSFAVTEGVEEKGSNDTPPCDKEEDVFTSAAPVPHVKQGDGSQSATGEGRPIYDADDTAKEQQHQQPIPLSARPNRYSFSVGTSRSRRASAKANSMDTSQMVLSRVLDVVGYVAPPPNPAKGDGSVSSMEGSGWDGLQGGGGSSSTVGGQATEGAPREDGRGPAPMWPQYHDRFSMSVVAPNSLSRAAVKAQQRAAMASFVTHERAQLDQREVTGLQATILDHVLGRVPLAGHGASFSSAATPPPQSSQALQEEGPLGGAHGPETNTAVPSGAASTEATEADVMLASTSRNKAMPAPAVNALVAEWIAGRYLGSPIGIDGAKMGLHSSAYKHTQLVPLRQAVQLHGTADDDVGDDENANGDVGPGRSPSVGGRSPASSAALSSSKQPSAARSGSAAGASASGGYTSKLKARKALIRQRAQRAASAGRGEDPTVNPIIALGGNPYRPSRMSPFLAYALQRAAADEQLVKDAGMAKADPSVEP